MFFGAGRRTNQQEEGRTSMDPNMEAESFEAGGEQESDSELFMQRGRGGGPRGSFGRGGSFRGGGSFPGGGRFGRSGAFGRPGAFGSRRSQARLGAGAP